MTTEQRDHGLPAKPSQFEKNSDLDTLLVRINDYLRQAEQSQPEPPLPKALPGITATRSSSNRRSQKRWSFMPVLLTLGKQ